MSYRTSIVEFYQRNPLATQTQVRLATGAPKAVVRFVYAQLVASGRLRPLRNGRPDVLSQPCAP